MKNYTLNIDFEHEPYLIRCETTEHEYPRDNLIHLFDDINNIGSHYIFKFPNNYGASIIKNPFSYGYDDDQWEIALLCFEGIAETLISKDFWKDGPIGFLSDEEVNYLLTRIAGYEPKEK